MQARLATWLVSGCLICVPALALAQINPTPPAEQTVQAPAPHGPSGELALLSNLRAIDSLEIQAGHMAEQKGATFQVREYGDRLVRDHTMADAMITSYAQHHNLKLVPQIPDPQQQATMQQLSTLSGHAFDRKFLQFMEQGHENAVQMLASARKTISDARVKSMVATLIPILEQHYTIASGLIIRQSAQGGSDGGQ